MKWHDVALHVPGADRAVFRMGGLETYIHAPGATDIRYRVRTASIPFGLFIVGILGAIVFSDPTKIGILCLTSVAVALLFYRDFGISLPARGRIIDAEAVSVGKPPQSAETEPSPSSSGSKPVSAANRIPLNTQGATNSPKQLTRRTEHVLSAPRREPEPVKAATRRNGTAV